MKKTVSVARMCALVVVLALGSWSLRAQQVAAAELPDAPVPQNGSAAGAQTTGADSGRHGLARIFPNYESASASDHLPPLTPGEKMTRSIKASFSPSVIVVRGAIAGINEARDATPEFHQGAAGYGRYFWHAYADAAVETILVQGIIPSIAKQDPRYYRLGDGGFGKRTGYAISRVVVTRQDGGGHGLNISEIGGAAAAGGISDLYYPKRYRTFRNAMEEGGLNVAIDAATFVVMEFWPEINHAVFRGPSPKH